MLPNHSSKSLTDMAKEVDKWTLEIEKHQFYIDHYKKLLLASQKQFCEKLIAETEAMLQQERPEIQERVIGLSSAQNERAETTVSASANVSAERKLATKNLMYSLSQTPVVAPSPVSTPGSSVSAVRPLSLIQNNSGVNPACSPSYQPLRLAPLLGPGGQVLSSSSSMPNIDVTGGTLYHHQLRLSPVASAPTSTSLPGWMKGMTSGRPQVQPRQAPTTPMDLSSSESTVNAASLTSQNSHR